MTRPVQRLLGRMPTQRPQLAVQTDRQGRVLVVGDRAVLLFGPFEPDDLGARNLAIVSLTQMGFSVNQVATAFELRPGTVSGLRTAFRRNGSAGVVKVSGRPATLDADAVARIRRLLEQGRSRQQVADEYGVTVSAVAHALTRHRRTPDAAAGPSAAQLPLTGPDQAEPSGQAEPVEPSDQAEPVEPSGQAEPAEPSGQAEASVQVEASGQAVRGAGWGDGRAFGLGPRVEAGTFQCRYAGAMLAHAYLERAGAGVILAGLAGAPWRRFDQVQATTLMVLALLLGVGSTEQVKTLVRAQAGPLTGLVVSPSLDSLRPRLAGIADRIDVPGLQTALATAMLAMPGQDVGLFYVDDHFVPYTGAKPVAMGHNGKRDRCEPGRADTLICDARGRAVCFTSAEPSHLSKTMQPVLTQLRQIVPDGRILLGFDRGGAYAQAFTACRGENVDFVTYRRGKLAPVTATPFRHQVRRARTTVEVILADEQITFSDDYTGPCRQLTLYETRGQCRCQHSGDIPEPGSVPVCEHLTAVLQVLTSDLTAAAPDLLTALKGRWVIENAFKYLDFYGIDWLVDYHAEITVNTRPVDNPARAQANTAIRDAKAAHADAQRALGALLTGPGDAAAKNTALPAAQQAVTDTAAAIKQATIARDATPVRLPANQVNPDAARALQRTHRRGLLMTLRLLAYNADTWLADHLNTYLQDANEYRATTRALMHQAGTITYTPQTITVTLDQHHSPRINRALTLLLDELNTHPTRIPGDPRPLTYQINRP